MPVPELVFGTVFLALGNMGVMLSLILPPSLAAEGNKWELRRSGAVLAEAV